MMAAGRLGLVTAVALTLALWPSARAAAHANLVRSAPAVNSVLTAPPAQVQLWFDDALEPGLNALSVLDAAGTVVSLGEARLGADRLTLTVALPPDLPHGTYTVAYRTVSTSDGHNVRGFYLFSIGPAGSLPPAAQHLAGIDWSLLAAPVTALTAWLAMVAALTLAGGVFLSGWLLAGPAHQQLWAAPAFMRDVRRVLAGSAVAVGVTQAMALAVYAAEAADASLAGLVTTPVLATTLTSSRFGAVWAVRLALGALLLAVVLRWHPVPGATRQWWMGRRLLPGVLAALLLLTFSSQSHAAAVAAAQASLWPLLMDWSHVLASAVWFGGVFFLVTLWAVGRAWADRGWLAQVAPAFGVWALIAAAVLAVTGVYQTGLQAPQPAPLYDTAYGWVLTIKQALVVAVVLAGVAARQALAARGDPAPRSGYPAVRRLRIGMVMLSVEALLAAGVLLAAAWLANTAPPREAAAAQTTAALGERSAGDLRTRVALRPRPGGDWDVDVALTDAEQAAVPNAARVTIGAGILGRDIGWSTVIATPQGYGRYRATVQWLGTDGPWGMFVTVRRRGVADDVTALYGVRVAGRQVQPLTYATSATAFYVGDSKTAEFWGLVETVGSVQTAGGTASNNDLFITLTDPSGGYLDWVERVRVSASPNLGPGGAAGASPGYREAAKLGPGQFVLRDVTMTVLGDWTVRVLLSGNGQDSAAEGFFTFLVGLDGVQSLDGGFPPGHH